MAKLNAPKGTRDFYPDAMRRRRYLEDVWRRVSLRAGFEEVDGPVFESLDLYVQKSGEEIVGQLYNFEDKGGRAVAIRPEFTPTLARMVVARQAALPKPVRWFNISRVCRYERAQKGRLREFFQWNCDILGAGGPLADAECIAVAVDALRELRLTPDEVEVRLSSRMLLAAMLKRIGINEETIPQVYLCLDKRGKAPDDVVEKMLDDLSITADQRRAIDELSTLRSPDEIPNRLREDESVRDATHHLDVVMWKLKDIGAAEFVRFDIGIVRGLAYYTGPVWEVFEKRGELRSLFGGGRYDTLIEACGGKPMPACGFGAGDVTMSLLLDQLDRWPEPAGRPEFYVATADGGSSAEALLVVRRLREASRSAVYALSEEGFNRQVKNAASAGVSYLVIVGTTGRALGPVRLRDVATGRESNLSVEELLNLPPPP